ncbi:MAG TPA: hypothetical protein VEJ18_21395 [Planctomycetota bacterium]|nr:hypothetical protein [Planctomycetota bacterium]
MATYRRPTAYIPPYNYCDRWCERCRIDKSRCLLWQTEMDARLHREIDGAPEPTPEEAFRKMADGINDAARWVEERARDMGVDVEPLSAAPPEEPVLPSEDDPVIAEGMAVTRAGAALLRSPFGRIADASEVLRRYVFMIVPKLARAVEVDREGDEIAQADAILQAQAVHRMLAEISAACRGAMRTRPSLEDALLDVLAGVERLLRTLEERWLSKPNPHLEPAPGDLWWGPLRDVSDTLKHFRR